MDTENHAEFSNPAEKNVDSQIPFGVINGYTEASCNCAVSEGVVDAQLPPLLLMHMYAMSVLFLFTLPSLEFHAFSGRSN